MTRYGGDYPAHVGIAHKTATVVRGRKCTICGKTMPPGTRYERHVYKLDGVFCCDVSCVLYDPDYYCPLQTQLTKGTDDEPQL